MSFPRRRSSARLTELIRWYATGTPPPRVTPYAELRAKLVASNPELGTGYHFTTHARSRRDGTRA